MPVHDGTAIEVGFEEVDDGQVRAGCDVHEALFVRDEGVGAVGLGTHVLCAGVFGVELLDTLLAEVGEGRVGFERGY